MQMGDGYCQVNGTDPNGQLFSPSLDGNLQLLPLEFSMKSKMQLIIVEINLDIKSERKNIPFAKILQTSLLNNVFMSSNTSKKMLKHTTDTMCHL
jgi:hypothetical protein